MSTEGFDDHIGVTTTTFSAFLPVAFPKDLAEAQHFRGPLEGAGTPTLIEDRETEDDDGDHGEEEGDEDDDLEDEDEFDDDEDLDDEDFIYGDEDADDDYDDYDEYDEGAE